jgi:site-specific recombinase XerD
VSKILLVAPEGWPSEARQLYRDFEARLRQRIQSWRPLMLVLRHLFRHQTELGLQWRDFPPALIASYLDGAPPRTWPHYRQAVRTWLRFLYVRKELLLPLHAELPIRRGGRTLRRRFLSHDQVLQLLALPPLDQPQGLRDRAILEMAYGTGLRRSELMGLNLSDLDLALGTVHVRQAKNGYARTVPMTLWARHFLQRYLAEARPLLASERSGQALWLTDHWGARYDSGPFVQRMRREYRVPEQLGFVVTLHMLRHSVATQLLAGGANLRDVQELLGHRSIASTEIYTHVTPLHLLKVHQRCHPRNVPGAFDSLGNSAQWEPLST